jgi:FKBP-type peptidyl-prolyl cis-trans isomerase FklB
MRLVLIAAAVLALTACDRSESQAQQPAAVTGEAAEFLAKNKTEQGVQTTPSGLQYKVIRSGPADGARPQDGDEVKVHYALTLIDGRSIESTYDMGAPAVFAVGDLIEGWNETLKLMKPGDEWYVYIPPNLGYGENGAGGVIPPNAVLVFRMELIDVLPKGGGVQRG